MSLDDAIKAAEANNRSILTAGLEKKKAFAEVYVARTQRLPIFSVTALGSQPLSHLGLTIEGSLGVYPTVGPFPEERQHWRIRWESPESFLQISRSR